jgi:hypothetical protein
VGLVPVQREIPSPLGLRAQSPKRPLNIRSAERRRYAAELLRDDVKALVLTGMSGIGKTVLARQISERIRTIHPGTSLTILDDFQPDPGDLEPATGKLLVTCRAPLTFSRPGVISRHIGPLTRSGAVELMLSLPRLRGLSEADRDIAWRLLAGHPGALIKLDLRMQSQGFAATETRLRAAVPGGLPDRIGPTELPAAMAESIAAAALGALTQHTRDPVTVRSRARWPLRVTAAALVLAALATGALRSGSAPSPISQARDWLATQVAPGTVIGCEPADCGIPGSTGHLDRASVLVITGDSGKTAVTLASFGTGPSRVRVLDAASVAAIRADQRLREIAGSQLARNPRLILPADARRQLVAGDVDARLLVTLAAVLQTGPASVVTFADSGPGASPGVPLREVTVRLNEPKTVRIWLLRQNAPFRPATTAIAGSGLLIVGFSAPSPLGLLNG